MTCRRPCAAHDADTEQEILRESIEASQSDSEVNEQLKSYPKFTHLTKEQLIEKAKINYPTEEGISFRQSNQSLYVMIHRFLNDHYGRKKICDICNRTDKIKYEFALKKGKNYSYDRNDYFVLCVSCHKKYDNNDFRNKKISEARKREVVDGKCNIANLFKGKIGKDHNCSVPIARLNINSGEVIETYASMACAERLSGRLYKASHISNHINGKKKSAYGFKWVKL